MNGGWMADTDIRTCMYMPQSEIAQSLMTDTEIKAYMYMPQSDIVPFVVFN